MASCEQKPNCDDWQISNNDSAGQLEDGTPVLEAGCVRSRIGCLVNDLGHREEWLNRLIQRGVDCLPDDILVFIGDKDKKTALGVLGLGNFVISRAVEIVGGPTAVGLFLAGNLENFGDILVVSMVPAAARTAWALLLQVHFRDRVNLSGAMIASTIPVGGTGIVFGGQLIAERLIAKKQKRRKD